MSQKTKKFQTNLYEVTYSVDAPNHNKRLDQYLLIHFQSLSRQQIKKIIDRGRISIAKRNHKLKPSTRVKEYEVITITTHPEDLQHETWRGKEIELTQDIEIIHDDKDWIAISKPPFMSTHPTGKHLFYCATVYLQALLNQPIYSVHRLDRETSGILILSKSSTASQKLVRSFEERKVRKMYFLIAHSHRKTNFPFVAKEKLGTRAQFIPELYTHCFPEQSTEGKVSETHFHHLYSEPGYVLALAFPKTGRQHQIRAHAAFHGFPLLGDKLYNGDPQVFTRFKDKIETVEDANKMQIPRHALHAVGILIPEYFQKPLIANLPHDLKSWINKNLNVRSEEIVRKIEESVHLL